MSLKSSWIGSSNYIKNFIALVKIHLFWDSVFTIDMKFKVSVIIWVLYNVFYSYIEDQILFTHIHHVTMLHSLLHLHLDEKSRIQFWENVPSGSSEALNNVFPLICAAKWFSSVLGVQVLHCHKCIVNKWGEKLYLFLLNCSRGKCQQHRGHNYFILWFHLESSTFKITLFLYQYPCYKNLSPSITNVLVSVCFSS